MRKGFSLIELLVVVLIMGILASVAMPQYFKSVEKPRAGEAVEYLKSLHSAYERIYMQNGGTMDVDYFFSHLDIGSPHMNYFTNTFASFTSTIRFTTERNASAGGGLGFYKIELSFPSQLNGSYTWSCYDGDGTRNGKCLYLLPDVKRKTSKGVITN